MCLQQKESSVQCRSQVIGINNELHNVLINHNNNRKNPTLERRWIQQGLPLYYGPDWRAIVFPMEHWSWLPPRIQRTFNDVLKRFKCPPVKPTRENLQKHVRIDDCTQKIAWYLASLLREHNLQCKILRKVCKEKY